jgi:uncharacterized protein (DUF58 family)
MLSRYLDPRTLNHVERLSLSAKSVVEGFMAGAHRSPYHGFSVEFAQHREYTQGDDPRHLDWKLYAKAGRYFIKQYEVETNLIAHILHDCSESMDYASPRVPWTKREYASYLTAALAYLIVNQADAVGAALFHSEIASYLEPRQSMAQVNRICAELEGAQAAPKTDTGAVLHGIAERIKRRGLVILISDLLDKAENILAGLDHLRFARQEVVVLQVMDPYELDFPFEGLVLFEGLEFTGDALCQPRRLRQDYLGYLRQHVLAIRAACERNRADHLLLRTDQPLEVALAGFLHSRSLRQWHR